jgi:hypothetical protein
MFLHCLQSTAMPMWTTVIGNACVLYACNDFFISARSIQNSEYAKNEPVYSGMDYTFPILFTMRFE